MVSAGTNGGGQALTQPGSPAPRMALRKAQSGTPGVRPRPGVCGASSHQAGSSGRASRGDRGHAGPTFRLRDAAEPRHLHALLGGQHPEVRARTDWPRGLATPAGTREPGKLSASATGPRPASVGGSQHRREVAGRVGGSWGSQ